MAVEIRIGDALEQLREMPPESVHCCVSSPPYWGLRDYGVDGQIGLEETPDEWCARLVEVFREVKRVLRADGTCWVNVGDSYASGGSKPTDEQKARKSFLNGQGGGGANLTAWTSRDQGTRQTAVGGLKPKDLIGQPWLLAFALRADGWFLRDAIVWCLSGGTQVYARTQKGEMPTTIKDLVRLDPKTVQLWNGEKWTQVLGWSETPRPDRTYEIELRSGQRIGCTGDHVWPTKGGNVRTAELVPGDVILTCQLPEPDAPETPSAIGDEFGYFVGLYLAEGSTDSRGRMQFSGHAAEHEQRMSALGYLTDDFGASVRGYVNGNQSTIVVDTPIVLAILRQYVHGKDARSKGLKVAAWRRSNRFLMRVLEGYLSGDGHFDEKNDRYRLTFTRNDRLAADLRTLCARLGLALRLAIGTAEGFGKQWPIYRGDVRLKPSDHHNARKGGEVVAIRESKARKFWDIGVEDEPHLFALASGVLTHNSKPNPMPESVKDRCTNAYEHVFLLAKDKRYFFDAEAIRERHSETPGALAWRRIFDPSKQAKVADLKASGFSGGQDGARNFNPAGRNSRNVWTIATEAFSEAHFATFPTELARRCILAGTSSKGVCAECGAPWARIIEPTGRMIQQQNGPTTVKAHIQANGPHGSTSSLTTGYSPEKITTGWQPTCKCDADLAQATVLDPFGGAGTTALVADRLQRNAVLIELNADYAAMARRRIDTDRGDLLDLFDQPKPEQGSLCLVP